MTYLTRASVLVMLCGALFLLIAQTRSTEDVPAVPAAAADATRENIKTDNLSDIIENKDNKTVENAASAKSVKAAAAGAMKKFSATAYCLKGRTALGEGVRRGLVAADPRIIPLGSRIKIDAGAYSGVYKVSDTGGAIKGHILDIWVPSCSEAIRFGRRSIGVTVIGKK